MRGRKLLDQTLPLKAAGTLVSLLERFPTNYYFAMPKSRFLKTHPSLPRLLRVIVLGCPPRLRDEISIATARMP